MPPPLVITASQSLSRTLFECDRPTTVKTRRSCRRLLQQWLQLAQPIHSYNTAIHSYLHIASPSAHMSCRLPSLRLPSRFRFRAIGLASARAVTSPPPTSNVFPFIRTWISFIYCPGAPGMPLETQEEQEGPLLLLRRHRRVQSHGALGTAQCKSRNDTRP